MHLLGMIAIAAVALVAVGWLAVSFLAPSPRRRRVEWLAATALYVALFCFFVNLVRRAIADDSTVGMIAFGFLATMFGVGLLISSWKTLAALRGRVDSGASGATH